METDDLQDIQWEYEADKEWDVFYKSYGIDRSELIRQMTTPIRKTLWKRIKAQMWGLYYRIFPPEYWR